VTLTIRGKRRRVDRNRSNSLGQASTSMVELAFMGAYGYSTNSAVAGESEGARMPRRPRNPRGRERSSAGNDYVWRTEHFRRWRSPHLCSLAEAERLDQVQRAPAAAYLHHYDDPLPSIGYQAVMAFSKSFANSSLSAGRGESCVTRCCGSVPSTNAGTSCDV
jgi:hypothetical protein